MKGRSQIVHDDDGDDDLSDIEGVAPTPEASLRGGSRTVTFMRALPTV